jgi:hypothetical protein
MPAVPSLVDFRLCCPALLTQASDQGRWSEYQRELGILNRGSPSTKDKGMRSAERLQYRATWAYTCLCSWVSSNLGEIRCRPVLGEVGYLGPHRPALRATLTGM